MGVGSDLWWENPSVISSSPEAGLHRVIRSSSWNYGGRDFRSAVRYHDPAVDRYDDVGFRLVEGPVEHR